MGVTIASILILAIAMPFAILLKRKLAETIALSTATIMLLLFFAGIMHIPGSLRFGLGAIIILACCSAVFIVRRFVKDKASVMAAEPVQGILIYLFFFLLSLYLCYGLYYYHADEYTIWGTGVRIMHFTDSLYTLKPDFLWSYTKFFTVNIPGSVLWGYFFGRLQPVFQEYPAYIANAMLLFSFVMPFVKNVFTKSRTFLCIIFFSFFMITQYSFVAINFTPFLALFVDALIGGIFGLAMLHVFSYDYGKSAYSIVFASCATLWLVAIKQAGILLAAGVCFVILVDVFLRRKQLFIGLESLWGKTKKAAGLLLMPIVSALGLYFIWETHLNIYQIEPPYAFMNRSPTFTSILNLLTMNLNEEELSTVRWFIERMLQPISMPPLSYPAILAVVTGFGLLAAFLINNKSSFKRKAVFILSALCATLFYQFILLNIYFTTFLGNETVSIDRYTSTGLMGLLLAAAVSILPSENEFSLSNIIAISKTYWENTIAMLLVASCGISLMANVFFYRNLSIHLGLYMAVRLLCLIFAAIAVILLSKNKFSLRNVTSFLQTRWKNTIAALLAIGCCVGLMASRFFLVDPTISLNRYTAVGLLCLFLAAAVAILPSEGKFALKNIIAISKTHWKNALAVMLVAGCCIGLLAMDNMRGERLMMNSLINVRDPEIRRNAYGPEYAPRAQAVADKWIPVMQELSKQPRPKVVVIAQEPQGFVTNNVLRFWHFSPYVDVYSPRMTADEGAIGWGVKEDLNITLANGDILHTQIDLSPDEWKEILLAHDHEFLYVYKADDNLILDYGQFFPDGAEDDMLYRIIRDESDVFFVRYDNETYY